MLPQIERDADKTAIQGHSRSSVVVPPHGKYDFLLGLNSNLTSTFNRLQISHPPLFHVTGKTRLGLRGHAVVSGCSEHWAIQPHT